jgi:hypothetical protein
MVSTPIGRFTTNTQRQSTCTSSPPSTGPAAAASPPTAAQLRVARVRRSAGTVASSSASDVGSWAAAPIACTDRATTRTHSVGAAAHARDARVNSATPARNTGRWPTRSPSRPSTTSSAARVSA